MFAAASVILEQHNRHIYPVICVPTLVLALYLTIAIVFIEAIDSVFSHLAKVFFDFIVFLSVFTIIPVAWHVVDKLCGAVADSFRQTYALFTPINRAVVVQA